MKLLVNLLLVTFSGTLSEDSCYSHQAGGLTVRCGEAISAKVQSKRDSAALQGLLGLRIPGNTFKTCTDVLNNEICLQSNQGIVTIRTTESSPETSCYTVEWDRPSTNIVDCYNLGERYWYGGGEVLYQHYPINNYSVSNIPYVTGDFFHAPYGGVIDNLWISSDGTGIFVDRNVPLVISYNSSGDNTFCMSSSYDRHPYRPDRGGNQGLKYTLCSSTNIRTMYHYALDTWMPTPMNTPDELLFRGPIWSTWAKYKNQINEKLILEFADEINSYKFPHSLLGIDDKWDSCYGNHQFDPVKFTDPKSMMDKLHNLGYKVLLWVHPFINADCDAYKTAVANGYVVKNSQGLPLPIEWWNGKGGILDVTNPAAVNWQINRLKVLEDEYGVDAFKFDAGETYWISGEFDFYDNNVRNVVNNYTKKYVEMAAKLGRLGEVRSGYSTQHVDIWTRMLDKDSRWTYQNGLKTLIPTALLFSFYGYSFVFPDYVAGNGYGSDIPEKELFIRWIEANALMPTIQLSILPWQYDDEVIETSMRMIKLHETYSDYFIELAKNSTVTGLPIMRAMWYAEPEDKDTYSIDDQYLVGDSLLVAPVLEQGARSRDIYIPSGEWKDGLRSTVVTGPKWLRNYSVQLDELPYFIRH